MGHALVARALPGTDPVQKVSIIPHGIGALAILRRNRSQLETGAEQFAAA